MSQKIEQKIKSNEILVRGLLHPFFASGNKMNKNAFLPAPEKCDVSVLRLVYADWQFCKSHTKSLKVGNSTYWGLGAFKNIHIDKINIITDIEIQAEVVCSPIDKNNNYIEDITVVTTDTLGLPMHADLRYSEATPQKGIPSTKHRKYAQELLKLAIYMKDENPDSKEWEMGDLAFPIEK